MSAAVSAPVAAGAPARPRRSGLLRLVWRQQRPVLRAWLVVIAVAAVAAPLLRAAMVSYVDSHHIAGCSLVSLDPACQTDAIQRAVDTFRNGYGRILQGGGALLLLLPALVGVFVGAPLLAREFESGTWKLVLTQSVSRTSWVGAKLATAGAVTLLGSAALAGLYRWLWLPSANAVSGVYWYSAGFAGSGGPVLVATALLALAVGAAAGAVLRRVLPAMAVSLGVVLLLQYLQSGVRPYLVGWHGEVVSRSDLPDTTWAFAQGFVTPSGERLPYDVCGAAADPSGCLAKYAGVREFNDVHPVTDYWPLQGVESGVCLLLAAALVVLTLYWTRRRPG